MHDDHDTGSAATWARYHRVVAVSEISNNEGVTCHCSVSLQCMPPHSRVINSDRVLKHMCTNYREWDTPQQHGTDLHVTS
jgi:hypothetical protein